MLILTRKPGEAICIGNDTRVTVVEVEYKRVRLGIEAPEHIAVDRDVVARGARKDDTSERRSFSVDVELQGQIVR